jgi:L-lactate dehydrogenase complex protein LldG
MNGAKELIFGRLGRHAVTGDTSYPSYSHPHTAIADVRLHFKTVLEEVGGECHFAPDISAARKAVSEFEVLRAAKAVCSYVPEVTPGNFDAEAQARARDCRDVGLTIVRGELGVAENGAVWVNADGMKQRGLLFLSENLILVVDGKNIVPDMESAYARIDFSRLRSGYFISGPSKTADIEQCLVVGAHGARSLIVVVVG